MRAWRLGLVWAVWLLAAPLTAQVATGTYVGDGSGARAISGLGFQPEVVIIKADRLATEGVARTSTMAGGSRVMYNTGALAGNLITSLDADGFTVGSDIKVNGLNLCGAGTDPCNYYWTAFDAGPNIVVGTYSGDGAATRSITGVGFSVDYLMLFPDGNKWVRNRTHFASAVLGTGANFRMRNAGQNATSIPSLDGDGFTIGNGNGDQEDSNSSGITYHYVAFNETPGLIKVGSYAGDGNDPRDLTGVGFRPAYVLVQSLDDGDQVIQKSDKMGALLSVDVIGNLLTTRINDLLADGFRLRNDPRVNGTSEDYAYVAFAGNTLSQAHYRWRNDDGPEGSGVPPSQAAAVGDVFTTSATDVALSGMSVTPGAGDYLVWFSGSVENSTGTDDQFVSIYLNGVKQAHTERQATTESSIPPSSFPVATHAFLPGVAAGQTIDVRWRTTGGTATMHQRTLVVAPVVAADVTQVSATTDLATGSTADVLATGMTITPGAGDYLVWFSSSVQASATGHQYVSLRRNGVAVPHTERQSYTESSIPDTSFPVATHAFMAGVGASEPIGVYWRTEAGTATMHERTLVVAKVGAADIFQATSAVDTPTTSATDVVAPPLTLTPGAGDYLAWFSGSMESDATSDQFATLYDNGTSLPHTVRHATTESSIPDTSFPVASHAYIPGVGGGEAVDVRWRTTGGNALMHERTLVLQKLSSTAGASWAAAEDTKLLGLAKSLPIRLRFSLANGGTTSSGATSYLLQVAETSTCSAGTYDTLATAGHWQIVDSSFVNDGDPSGNSAGLSDSAATFVPGELKDAADTTGAITLSADSFTEIEFTIEATVGATDGGDYCFRLFDATNGEALSSYGAYAEVQLGGGTLTLSDHDVGQIPDRFTSAPFATDVLYRFKLSRTPPVNVSNLRVRYTTGGGVANGDVVAGALYRDVNADGLLDGGDVPLQTGINGAGGQLAFTGLSEDPGAGTNYIVVATVNNLVPGDTTTFSLGIADIDEVQGGVVESGTIGNAIHVANAARTVYYSVGASVADLKNGAPAMTLASGTATLTVPQPPNVGIGDEITYNVTDKVYISGRISSTVYTVTTATGLIPVDDAAPVDSIRRAFNDLKTAVLNADDAQHLNTFDLVANDLQLNLVGYNDGPDPSHYVRIEEPWITGPTNYIRVFTPTLPSEVGVSQRHTGVAGTGYRIAPVGPAGIDYFNFILVSTDFGYVRVEGVEIDGSGLTLGENLRGMMANDSGTSQDVRFTHNLIHDITNTTIDENDASRVVGIFLDATDDSKVANNIIYNLTSVSAATDGQARGIDANDPGMTHHVYNNTLHNIRATATTGSARGIVDEPGGTIFARNNYVGLVESVVGGEACFTGPFAAENNNVSADATAVGAGSVGGQSSYASYFVDVTPGSENFHLLSDSNALWGTDGADLDADPVLAVIDDIDGEPRHPSTPDVGADEASVTTLYRSIGTAPDYSTGTIDTTAGSSTVDGTGTAWLAQNRGRGDRIDINGTDYTILSVLSDTRLVLAEPAAATYSGPYTISRQFSTLQAWEDCISGAGGCTFFPVASASLVNDDRREVGVAYNDSVVPADPDFTANLVFQDAITDATHTITLTAIGDNRHYGIPGAGVLYDCSGCVSGSKEIEVRDDYVTVEWLEVVGVNDGSTSAGVRVLPAFNVLLQYLLVHGNSNGIRMSGNPGKSMTVRNSIVYDNVDIGIEGDEPGDILVVENCTVFNNGQRGVWGALSPSTTTVRNTISMSNPAGDDISSADIQENNITSDGTASCATCLSNRDYTDLAAPGAPPQGNGWVMFQSLAAGSEDFHLRDNLALNDAQDTAQDLSSSFVADVDAALRVSPWDVGADDVSATTAVELVSFEATGYDAAVVLEWETGSEMDNLGFRLYRAANPNGPFESITASLIPGLGSSPEGARYRHVDSDVVNGVTYYYELEDIETTGATERHGPVFATPVVGAGSPDRGATPPESPTRITYGAPEENTFRVLRRGRNHAVIELTTHGFYAEPQEDGSVLLSIPDFELLETSGFPVIPVKRPWVEVARGRGVAIASVRADSVVSFDGLRPSGTVETSVVASSEGGLRATRRGRRSRLSSKDVFPAEAATLLSTGFQGSTQKAQLQLAPLRWDGTSSELLLARRLVVRLSFTGRVSERPRKRPGGERVIARLATRERGLYAVRYEDVARGGRLGIDSVRLTRQGNPVPFHLESPSGRFRKGAILYFVGEGGDANPYGTEAVYELEAGTGGIPMELVSASPSGAVVPHYWQRDAHEENRIYSPSLLSASDLWLWDVLVAPVTKSYPFTISGLAATVVPARLELALQGSSDFEADPDHHLRVYVNDALVADTSWDGKRSHAIEAELMPGVLREGSNVLAIESVGDTEAAYSVTMLDRFALTYPRQTSATNQKLEGRFDASGSTWVSGLGDEAFVVDTTAAPRWLTALEPADDGSVRFEVLPNRTYLVTSRRALLHPEVRLANDPGLSGVQGGVEYLVIGPRVFLDEAQPLVDHRRTQGLSARAVALEDVYDVFGHGESRPDAVRAFLAHVYHEWTEPKLRYVVLLGDATYDYKNYLGTGALNAFPPLLVPTSYLWTASDPALAAVNGDDRLPDVAIGRLAASDENELRAMVSKILAYERGDTGLDRGIVLVADNSDRGGDFDGDVIAIADRLFAGRDDVETIRLSQLGASAARDRIFDAFATGSSVMSYVGHGGIHLWADETLLHVTDVATLAKQSQQPILLTMNCLNGYFHFPYADSLAEELVKAQDGGAIAAFSPSGFSHNVPAGRLHQFLLDAIVNRGHARLGDAILSAQEAYAQTGMYEELLSIYQLLGDPALVLR